MHYYPHFKSNNFTVVKEPQTPTTPAFTDFLATKLTLTTPLLRNHPELQGPSPTLLVTPSRVYWKTPFGLRTVQYTYSESQVSFGGCEDLPILGVKKLSQLEDKILVLSGESLLSLDTEGTTTVLGSSAGDLQVNPYIPRSFATLDKDHLSTFGVRTQQINFGSEYLGFDYFMSPLVLILYKSDSVYLYDFREDTQHRILDIPQTKHVLPSDETYQLAVLSQQVQIYDCRFWKVSDTFNHSIESPPPEFLFPLPDRASFYRERTHQQVFGISPSYVEEYPFQKPSFNMHGLMKLVSPTMNLPELKNSISFHFELSSLQWAGKIEDVWVQACVQGGLYVESSTVCNFHPFFDLHNPAFKEPPKKRTFYVVDKRDFFEEITQKPQLEQSSPPKLNIEEEQDFEDFEDF